MRQYCDGRDLSHAALFHKAQLESMLFLGEEYDGDDSTYYELDCPSCGETICFDDSLDPDSIVCPACGEKISDVELCDGECENCDSKDCE